MAQSILAVAAAKQSASRKQVYSLPQKDRLSILAGSDSFRNQDYGVSPITNREIEAQRQAFIEQHGEAF